MPRKDKTSYNEYMKSYMIEYRKLERELIRQARQVMKKAGQKRG
jgi:hypothetical protein